MLSLAPEAVERYAAEHCPEESPLVRDLVAATRERTDAPVMQVGRLQGAFMRLLTLAIGARRVLEFGTFTGYSALAFAEGLPDDGEVVTLDVDPRNTAIAREFWDLSPHGKKIRLLLGDARQTVRTLAGSFDLAFIDADKAGYIAYWEAAVSLVRPGGLLLADNVLWNGHVTEPRDGAARTMAAFNDHVRKDARVEAVMLTIRDGLTVARKK